MTAPHREYLALAATRPLPRAARGAIRHLPALDEAELAQLAAAATTRALSCPRQGWTPLRLAEIAGRTQNWPPARRGAIAVELSLLASYWGRPRPAALYARRGGETVALKAAAEIALNLNPWTRPDFQAAHDQLLAAVAAARRAGQPFWVAQGLHALAFAQLLLGKLPPAGDSLDAAEAGARELGDRLLTLRIGRTRSGWLWRQGERAAAAQLLEQVRTEFESLGARPDVVMADYQAALRLLGSGRDYPAAQRALAQAAQDFRALEMDLWAAQAENGMAQAAYNQGHLAHARDLGAAAVRAFERHGILGLQADAENDLARVAHLYGDLPDALRRIDRAGALYRQVGAEPSAIRALVNQGRFLLSSARYQQALTVFEQAQARLEGRGYRDLEAWCEFQLGLTWVGLGQLELAESLLTSSLDKYGQTGRTALQAEVHQALAGLSERQGDPERALAHLDQSLRLADTSGDVPVRVAADVLRGELLLSLGQTAAARDALERARQQAQSHALDLLLARTLTAQGALYQAAGQPDQARPAWEAGLVLAAGTLPEIEARLQLHLARLAAAAGNDADALQQARQGLAALRRVRRDFWQPRLAAGYAGGWEEEIFWAAADAARQGDPAAALNAMEAGGAQAFIRAELAGRDRGQTSDPGLNDLRAEIAWLMAELQVVSGLGAADGPRRRALGDRLKQARGTYERAAERREREGHTGGGAGPTLPLQFQPESFRGAASRRYPAGWLALDYILQDDALICAWLTPETAGVVRQTITPRQRQALAACERIRVAAATSLLASDLQQLAALLLPAEAIAALTPETRLLIAPHGPLHAVPWLALCLPDKSYLVERCVPVLVPSLEAWELLAARPAPAPRPRRGVGVAVSEFGDRLNPLPGSRREAELLLAQPGLQVDFLCDHQATPAALAAALASTGEPAAFLHLATHLFVDRVSGRLSGIALHQEMLLLDQLDSWPRLPAEVFLSGCNGTRALALPGGERQDFLSALLLAGAEHIVGSLWQIPDDGTLALVERYYAARVRDLPPAVALAESQRQLARGPQPWWTWGGYQCVGL